MRELQSDADCALTRRCVDVAELIAHAQAGAVDVVLVDASLPGLDLDAVRALRDLRVVLVGLGDAERAAAIGIERVVAPTEAVAVLRSLEVADRDPRTEGTGAGEGPDASGSSGGRLIAVWGPTGAPGRSTVALSLADACAAAGRSTLLVDADVFGGVQAQLLGLLDEVSGLMAACRAANHGREDPLATAQRVAPRLDVLTGIPRADMWVHLRRGPLETVLEQACRSHDAVVADLGFCLEPGEGVSGAGRHQATRAILERADSVVAVGRADPTGLARIVRGLAELAELGIDRPVLVLNRVRERIGWSERELTSTLERLAGVRPVVLLPDDPAVVDAALLRGTSPRGVAADSSFARGAADLAARLLPAPPDDTADTATRAVPDSGARSARVVGARGTRW